MKLSDLGEFGFISRIAGNFDPLVKDNTLGIGDDCSVIRINNDESILVTTDMLVEDVHFLLESISPVQLGYKSLAVNLSDIAAMGGRPIGSFISLSLPKDVEVSWIDDFYKGYRELSEKYTCPLLGGDTTGSTGKICINVTVIGKSQNSNIKYRSGAKPGDYICVSDYLGDSAAGLDIIMDNDQQLSSIHQYLVNRHLMPEPFIREGRFLSDFKSVNSMMDISDGIASDLEHITSRSKAGAEIYLEKIPMTEQLKIHCEINNINPLQKALNGGEDYCLLMTISANEIDIVKTEYKKKFDKELYVIGKINDSGKVRYISDDGTENMNYRGFDHFNKS